MRLVQKRRKETRQESLFDDFVRRVSALPQVQEVVLDERSAPPRIWTVIRGPGFDYSLRESIYRAELQTLDAFPSTRLDFRLINLDEFEGQKPREVLPPKAKTLWSRAASFK